MPLSQSDNGGSAGNALTLFERANALIAPRPEAEAQRDAKSLRAEALAIRRSIAEATKLESAAMELREAEHDAAVLRRRLARSIATEQRHLEVEQRRAEGGLYSGERRVLNQPTRVDVDPCAWLFVKRDTIERSTTIGYLVGALVTSAVRHSAPADHGNTRCVTQRFVRLLLVDAETWRAFRSLAFDAHVTTQRLVGVLVEIEARRLGWQPKASR